MWPPIFGGVIPTYGVLPYTMILRFNKSNLLRILHKRVTDKCYRIVHLVLFIEEVILTTSYPQYINQHYLFTTTSKITYCMQII